MLQKTQRIDGFLGLSVENSFFQDPTSEIHRELISFPVAGGQEYLVGYVGCSKSPVGQEVIKAVNKVLVSERSRKIKEFYQRWLLPKDKATHEALIERTF